MKNINGVNNPIVPGVKLSKKGGGAEVDITLYKQMIGSLMYLNVTRPGLMFVVCLASRYMSAPTEAHFQVVKRILRYIKGTMEFGILYRRGGDEKVLSYTDNDYAGDLDDRKSTSGFVFLMCGGVIAWSSKKQPIVALSTTEAEYIAAVSCATQGIWMKRILAKIGKNHDDYIVIRCDNSYTIQLSKNPVFHGRSKHIEVRFHYPRDQTREGRVKLIHCGTQDQVADIMTKPLKQARHIHKIKEDARSAGGS
ncbi:secreted RxLR effector protein 161-like [Lathyrus oleraceus]|uniref:secreted RxLR effector protein 161-like n=1 Tax=Pisum sativum TaxID=3888 RepID=UPI0021CFB3EC|nr:secreted RxLR effector protein 161-like [Pisum sativum]